MTKKTILTSLLVPTLASLCVGFVNVTPKVIYGDDNRADVYEIQDAVVREVANSTVAIIHKKFLKPDGNGRFIFTSTRFGPSQEMCSEEPYFDQPDAAICSGSLVGEDLIATAGHCVNHSTCKNYYYVFGYQMSDLKTAPESFSAEEIYTCKGIVAREYSNDEDFALLRLNRPVLNHRPLTLQRANAERGDEVYVVGHPSGLPTKVAGGAIVRKQEGRFFTANLDSYGGNSGSAVLNARTHEVVGILVRGSQDFKYDQARMCYRSNVCDNNGCGGEDVTNISYIAEALNQPTR